MDLLDIHKIHMNGISTPFSLNLEEDPSIKDNQPVLIKLLKDPSVTFPDESNEYLRIEDRSDELHIYFENIRS